MIERFKYLFKHLLLSYLSTKTQRNRILTKFITRILNALIFRINLKTADSQSAHHRKNDFIVYLGYDGQYHSGGLQKCHDHRLKQDTSVHTQLVNALGYQKCVIYYGGRTDAGVSASCNALIVKNVREESLNDVNLYLPFGIHVLGYRKIDSKSSLSRFTEWVAKRQYFYFIKKSDYPPLDVEKITEFVEKMDGQKLDFRNLCKWADDRLKKAAEKATEHFKTSEFREIGEIETKIETRLKQIFERIVEFNISENEGGDIVLKFCSSGFLTYQIRTIVTVIVAVGLGIVESRLAYDKLFEGLSIDADKLVIEPASPTPLVKHNPLLTPEFMSSGIIMIENEYLSTEVDYLKRKRVFLKNVIAELETDNNFSSRKSHHVKHINTKTKNMVKYKNGDTSELKIIKSSKKLSDFILT